MFIRPLALTSGIDFWQLLTNLSHGFNWQLLLVIYFLIAVTNTMFLSKEDIHSWLGVIILSVTVGGLLFLSGWLGKVLNRGEFYLAQMADSLLYCLVIVELTNIAILIILTIWQKLLELITHKRVI
jgi:hypothetical protein